MSAPRGDSGNEDAGTEKLIELFDNINEAKKEESAKPGGFMFLIRNPLMAAGMGATGYFFYRGMRAASAGESLNLAAMLQKRVMGQFSTLAIIIASFTYYMAQSPDAMKNSEIDTRALNARAWSNYQEAQNKKAGV